MRGERRSDFRVDWNLPATIFDLQRDLVRPCVLSNFSNTGAKITGLMPATIPDEFILQITTRRTHKCRVLWRSGGAVGVEFFDYAIKAESFRPKRRTREPA